jgi:glycopeptide antibiotics resistance protein
MALNEYLNHVGIPWFFFMGFLVVTLSILVAMTTRLSWFTSFFVSAAVFVPVTAALYPPPMFMEVLSAHPFGWSGIRTGLSFELTRLLALSDPSINALMFVPLGLALGSLFPKFRWWVACLLYPAALECTQSALPWLARDPAWNDAAMGWLGLTLGVVAGLAGRLIFVVSSHARKATTTEGSSAAAGRGGSVSPSSSNAIPSRS